MNLHGSPRWEIGVAAFFVAACALILWETRDIPPGTFEPLGSAPVPQSTAILIMVLSVVVAIGAWRRLRAGEVAPPPTDYRPRPLDAFALGAMTIAYVLVLDARVIDFAPLTALFLFLAIGLLVRLRPAAMVAAAAISALVGWGAQYVFTRVFVVDLPGL